MANVERAAASLNLTPRERALRIEQAKELGLHNVPIDPRTVNSPAEWHKGKRLNIKRPEELNDFIRARREGGGS